MEIFAPQGSAPSLDATRHLLPGIAPPEVVGEIELTIGFSIAGGPHAGLEQARQGVR